MKHCPSCKTNYADDTLQFCLQDGTQLVELANSSMPTIAFNDAEAETVVRLKQTAQNRQQQTSPPASFVPQYAAPPPQKSSTALAVLLTAFVMLLLFGLGFGAWLFLGNRKNVANIGNRDFPTATVSNANSNTKPTASPSSTISNSNANVKTPTPDIDADEIESQVSGELNAWKASLESGNLDSVMGHYATTLDYYYRSGTTNSATVRANKKPAFDKYYEFHVSISGMRVTPDASGQKATAVFNKSWRFEGSGDRSVGTVRAQFQLTKIGSRWFITGEKDL
ncbi:MAG TPA: hypothetical protein VGC76_08085 [Pyrinomonadaceae bacterium]|jgi:hypothetical protein